MDIQKSNKHMQIHSTPLAIRETQTNVISRYHYLSIRMAEIKNTLTVSNADKDAEKLWMVGV